MALTRGFWGGLLLGTLLGALLPPLSFLHGSSSSSSGSAPVPCVRKSLKAGALVDPSSLGEEAHEISGLPWPAEFRAWLVDTPETLPNLFKERGMIQGTDKTTTHRYQYPYAKYLLPVRHRYIQLLEIGLGCDTTWGAGHSVDLWHELLPRMTYYSIEHHRDCALAFVPRLGDRQFIGDQSNGAFLDECTAKTGPLDVVIDDGSHNVNHQRYSFEHLWPAIKPGGIYVLEDLQTTFLGGYGGESSGQALGTSGRMITDMVLTLLGRGPRGDADGVSQNMAIMDDVASVDCFRECCVFVKGPARKPGERP